MKQCPNCRTTYADESLRFCLADGAGLVAVADAPETVRMNFGNERVRIDIPPDSAPTVLAAPPPPSPSPAKKSLLLPIIGLFGFLLVLAVGGFAAFVFLRPKINEKPTVTVSPIPTAAPSGSPTAAPNDETARLKEEMANLQKQIREQKNQSKTNSGGQSLPPKSNVDTTARANSPRDGFLALRSEPNSETGYRVAKIPHGAIVTVLGCPKPSNVGKMAGRWCQIVYNGESGWAFDGFMIF